MFKPWLVTIVLFIAFIAGGWTIYQWWTKSNTLPPINNDNYKVVGIIDFADKHNGPDYERVRKGEDAVLVVDHTQPYYGHLMAKNPETANDPYSDIFRLQIYDETGDGILDNEDSIWSHLSVLVYDPDTATYTVKSLATVGIHAIILKHLTPHGNHVVILSNGAQRTLYETTKWSQKEPTS